MPLPPTTVVDDHETTTTTSSTSTTTSRRRRLPLPPVANAGEDLAVDVSNDVTLTAIELSEPNQSIVWRQVGGPDVTDGAGRLRGNDATFLAPGEPSTLFFEVDVTGRGGEVETDDLRIDVFEDADQTVFVDGRAWRRRQRRLPRTARSAACAAHSSSRTGAPPTSTYGPTGETYSTGDALAQRRHQHLRWLRRRLDPRHRTPDRDHRLRAPESASSTRCDRCISAVDVVGPAVEGTDPSYGVVAGSTGELVIEHADVPAGMHRRRRALAWPPKRSAHSS